MWIKKYNSINIFRNVSNKTEEFVHTHGCLFAFFITTWNSGAFCYLYLWYFMQLYNVFSLYYICHGKVWDIIIISWLFYILCVLMLFIKIKMSFQFYSLVFYSNINLTCKQHVQCCGFRDAPTYSYAGSWAKYSKVGTETKIFTSSH